METAMTELKTKKRTSYLRIDEEKITYALMQKKFESEREEIRRHLSPKPNIWISSLSFPAGGEAANFNLTYRVNSCKVLNLVGRKTIDEIAGEMADVVLFFDSKLKQIFPKAKIHSTHKVREDSDIELEINYTLPTVWAYLDTDIYHMEIHPYKNRYSISFHTNFSFIDKKSLTLLERIKESPSITFIWEMKSHRRYKNFKHELKIKDMKKMKAIRAQ